MVRFRAARQRPLLALSGRARSDSQRTFRASDFRQFNGGGLGPEPAKQKTPSAPGLGVFHRLLGLPRAKEELGRRDATSIQAERRV
jgi:hypothetical protein